MKVIKIFIGLLLLAVVFSASGFLTYEFPGWRGIAKISSYIFIVRCTSSPGWMRVTNDIAVVERARGKIVVSAVRVLSILKGANASEETQVKVHSQYWLHQGETYLIFATSFDGSTCQALDDYRVVPLGHLFPTNMLNGKSLDEQIKALLQYRLNNLNRELEQAQIEKQRLEEGLKK